MRIVFFVFGLDLEITPSDSTFHYYSLIAFHCFFPSEHLKVFANISREVSLFVLILFVPWSHNHTFSKTELVFSIFRSNIKIYDFLNLASLSSKIRRNLSYKAAVIFKILWDYLMFYQIFLSPQMKRCAAITYKYSIRELLHELPNDLRLSKWRILVNEEIIGNCLSFIEW